VSLRLFTDYTVCQKEKLYVVYIDFSKAYDPVPRQALIAWLNWDVAT